MRTAGEINVTVEPRAEPLHLTEVKAHLRRTDNAEDALIASLIPAARAQAEGYLNRPLVLQTIELAFQQFHECFRLDRMPMMKFGSVQYKDSAGDLQTLSTSVYQVDTKPEPGKLTRQYAQVWPQIRGGEDRNNVIITYQAGYLAPVAVADANADTLEVKDNPFVNGDPVWVSQSGGAVPAGLAEATRYYVVQAAGDTFKLSLTVGGAAVNIADAGSGNIFVSKKRLPGGIKQAMLLIIGHLYANREDSISGTIITQIPRGARAFLAPHRIPGHA